MSCKKLITRIIKNKYRNFKKWSDHAVESIYQYGLKKEIRKLLILVSGNDLTSMIHDILDEKEKCDISYKYYNVIKLITLYLTDNIIVLLTFLTRYRYQALSKRYQSVTKALPKRYLSVTKALPKRYQSVTKALPKRHQAIMLWKVIMLWKRFGNTLVTLW